MNSNLSPDRLGKHSGIADEVAKSFRVGNELLYRKLAANADHQHLRNISREIDEGLKTEDGVAIARLTIRRPDPAGNYLPQYVGLLVVGFGADPETAKSNSKWHETKERVCVEFGESRHCIAKDALVINSEMSRVCTAENPTGEAPRESGTVSSVSSSYNIGYGAHIASKVTDVIKKNPQNQKGGMVLHREYLERELLFISKDAWEEIKAKHKNK